METGKQPLEKRLAEIEADIDKFLSSKAPDVESSTVFKLLGLSQEEMRGLSRSDCEEAAILLSQYSLTLQKESNKYVAISIWLDSTLDFVIADKLQQYSGYSFQERKLKAVKGEELARRIEKLKVEINLKKNSLYMLHDKIDKIAKYYSELGRAKWNH